MDFRYLQHARRGICVAIAVALWSPLGVAAQPSSPGGSDAPAPASGSTPPQDASGAGAGQQSSPAAAGSAPTDLGTVIVTANKRSERLQDVPMAVSALQGLQLERESAVSFADYATRVPGLNVISSGQGRTQLVLRGITSGSGQPNSTVGTYIDDVPFGSSTVYAAGSVLTPDIDPADLERVEVLRGPQGTLYGSNTLGGLVKFVTTPPDATRAYGRVRAGVSSVEDGGTGSDVHAMFNVPLAADKLALRINAYERHDPGYVDNVLTGKRDVNRAKVSGTRAQLLWTPSDTVSLRLSALAQNLGSDGAGLVDGGVDVDALTLKPIHGDLQQVRSPGTGQFRLKYRLYDASLNADFGGAKLFSSTSYGTLDMNSNADITAAYGPLLNPLFGLPNGGYSLVNPMTLDKFTQELRLQSPETQTVEWRAGVFYTREKTTAHQNILSFDASTGEPIALPTLADLSMGPAIFTEWAAYGDLTWHATSRFSVLVGARYSSDRTTYAQTGDGLIVGPSQFTIRGSDNPTTYLLNPSFRFSDDLMVYGRIASGFRPGGPNVGVPPGLGAPLTFGPDKLVSYELGLKATTMQRRMTFDVSAFYIDWSQIQLTVVSGGIGFMGNGGKASSKGVEAAWQYAPARGLLLSANASWTDAKLDADTPPGLFGYKGDRLPYVPKWNASVGVDYDFPLAGGWSGFVGAGYRYVGERKTDFVAAPGPRRDVPDYDGVDLRAGVNVGNWTIKAYVKNLTNERGITSLASETTDPHANPFAAVYVMPRTVGLSASVDF
ncbi:TonB-dependent receptor [Rhodanobacter spathiphylli]|uniref:TonB-dependent receptor n=1 Tax=Rhodanobacter spathiphylli B39 TaxID=1163407 RepID=I4W3M1_9GAMM|nr:TonB-dependent receptor [Rhodanobacter spathiphylli]EIL94062.1 TonB-dependent receptor [Rhodanobacter spathiphylli B39]